MSAAEARVETIARKMMDSTKTNYKENLSGKKKQIPSIVKQGEAIRDTVFSIKIDSKISYSLYTT